jgi:hypothetical protein
MNKIRINLSQEEHCKFSKITSSGSGASFTVIFLLRKKFFLFFLFIQQQHKKYFKFFILLKQFPIILFGKSFKKFSCSSIVLKVTKITPEKFFFVKVFVSSNKIFRSFSNLVFSLIISERTWYCSQHSP